jgi:hypothetical protein
VSACSWRARKSTAPVRSGAEVIAAVLQSQSVGGLDRCADDEQKAVNRAF